jgi:hypothetical protein
MSRKDEISQKILTFYLKYITIVAVRRGVLMMDMNFPLSLFSDQNKKEKGLGERNEKDSSFSFSIGCIDIVLCCNTHIL